MNNGKIAEFQIPGIYDLDPDDVVTRLVDEAAKVSATDVFLSAHEKNLTVAIRHLGIVRGVATFSEDLGKRLISHVKAMAGLDLAERRHAMGGRWVRRRDDGGRLDLRISTIPTLYGEDVAIRLLEPEAQFRSIDQLGLSNHQMSEVLGLLNHPGGLILVTGPTGSGKTTTLYSFLHFLNSGTKRINTIEDPIEYALDGVRQSQVDPRFGMDFPDLLRAVLRQGPDVIMIGEIRDSVTATTVVRAANSGHLVCATLHAPMAAGAIESMLALGAHPHFLSSCLLGIVTQRLLRTLCPDCKTEIQLGDDNPTFESVRQWLEPGQGNTILSSEGCSNCLNSGYTKRTGVFEVLKCSKALRGLISAQRPTHEIAAQAVDEGLIEIRRSALLKLAQGETNIEEIMRVIPPEHLGVAD